MTKRRLQRQDPIEAAIEEALQPGQFVRYGASWNFISGLEDVAGQVGKLMREDAGRAARLYETFLAGCYEKAEEVDDSGGDLGMFVDGLYCGWIKARQAANSNADETAKLLLDRMENDPYGFASQLEQQAVKVMDRPSLRAFERAVRERYEAKHGGDTAPGGTPRRDLAYARRRWGEVLRAIYARQHDVTAYVALCEETELSAQDCLTVATILRARRKAEEALTWVDRGLAFDKKQPHGSMAGYDLAKVKRELLTKLGRSRDALEQAWSEFCEHPSKYSYEELLRFVPKDDRSAWHAKAMEAAERADLGSLIQLWLETKEIDRLVKRLREAKDAEIEGLSHYTTEPAAKRLAKSHPDVAAKVYRALGMRILNAKKSKYYDAALSNFEDAKRCYERAGLAGKWDAIVAEVRQGHNRKVGFMGGFEWLVAGCGPSEEPSFLDRARRRWLPEGQQ